MKCPKGNPGKMAQKMANFARCTAAFLVKRDFWFALLISSVILNSGIVEVRSSDTTPQTVSASYQFELPQMDSVNGKTRLTVSGCGQLNRISEPALPFRTARLLLPSGYAVEKVEAVPLVESVKLEGKWQVEYSGEPHSICIKNIVTREGG